MQEEIKIPESKKPGFLSKRDALLNKVDALVLEADQLSHEEKYAEAIRRYDEAIAIFPLNPDIWEFKAMVLRDGLNRQKEAEECFERAQKLHHRVDKSSSPDRKFH